eukprot:9473795-Pyramimonas_sp.AAC.1
MSQTREFYSLKTNTSVNTKRGLHGRECNLPVYEAAGATVGRPGRQLDAAELARVDAVICARPAAACQLYIPLNRYQPPLETHHPIRTEPSFWESCTSLLLGTGAIRQTMYPLYHFVYCTP